MSKWSRRLVAGSAAAGLCLVGVLETVTAAHADTAKGRQPSFSCGSFDNWSSAAPGTHVSTTAVLGSTKATLVGTIADVDFGWRGLETPTLVIRDGDRTVRSGPVDWPQMEDQQPPPAPVLPIIPDSIVRGSERPDVLVPLCVVHLADNDHPVVLVGLFTGGAHCCTVLRVHPLTGRRSRAGVDIWIWNPGVDVRRNPYGTGAIVVTADDVFNYEFAPYASSGVPIKVLTFRDGRFADITRAYPALVRKDAERWWKGFSDDPPEGLGMLPAWMADQCLLGKGKDGWATIDRLLAEGKLAGPPDNGGTWPAGADYVAALHAFLPQHGYCSEQGHGRSQGRHLREDRRNGD